MPVELRMPALGMTMEEGRIVAWRVAEGERVTRGQIVVEIESEKAAYEVEAPVDGTIAAILVKVDDVVPVGTPLVSLLPAAEAAVAPAAAPGSPSRARLSPRARALAESLGVDVTTLAGSGPGGTIVEKDIRDAAAARATASPSDAFTVRELTSMRRTIAERMSQSAHEAPHFFLAVEIDGANLLAWRAANAARLAAEAGTALTITDLLVAATARTLAAHRSLNASWSAGAVREWTDVNLGLAVAVDAGLIVPVIHRAGAKPIAVLMRDRADVVARARARKLRPGDLEGGTFTLSNLGAFGIDFFTSILNPPEAGILSVGALRERPVVVDGRVVARPTMLVGLTIDHRVTDGAGGAGFLRELTTRIEAARFDD